MIFIMDLSQIKKYLPSGWDVVDLIDHGIIDLDIMNGKMMGEYVAMLMIKACDDNGSHITTFSFHDKDMDTLRDMVRNSIVISSKRRILLGDGNTAIK